MSGVDDFDLGLEDLKAQRPKRGRGRPKGTSKRALEAKAALAEEAAEAERERVDSGEGDTLEVVKTKARVEHLMQPLSAAQLGQIFRMDRKTIQARLRGCPAAAKTPSGGFLYDVAQAAGYLVEPKVDIEAWIKRLRPNDLPPYLQDSFWAALEKRQRVELKAGDLWETEKVIEVFGELAKRIKSTVMLWTDQLERNEKLTTVQRDYFTRQCDALLGMVFDAYAGLQEERTTENLLERYRREAAPEGETPPGEVAE